MRGDSNPHDAKGLLISSIESDDPVMFFEPKRLYRGPFDGDPHHVLTWDSRPGGDVPSGYYRTPLGRAVVAREGTVPGPRWTRPSGSPPSCE